MRTSAAFPDVTRPVHMAYISTEAGANDLDAVYKKLARGCRLCGYCGSISIDSRLPALLKMGRGEGRTWAASYAFQDRPYYAVCD